MLIKTILEGPKNQISHGSDDITIKQFKQDLEKVMLQLVDELKRRAYKPKSVTNSCST